MTDILIKAALGYLLGSIVGSLLVGRLRGGVDIRHLGSGNAGGTNALRTQGKAFAFWVLLIDLGHGELERFAGNMLELGTWDEALGDYRLLVMSETARHSLPP
ncbi:MAG TPA: glycerol-3-phosphate acyltransferase, partial [Steroidobacteraceae bacterium]|nr:glycerol-3-phosphate acyltransferase [Steroidobacteraceae bacterium]